MFFEQRSALKGLFFPNGKNQVFSNKIIIFKEMICAGLILAGLVFGAEISLAAEASEKARAASSGCRDAVFSTRLSSGKLGLSQREIQLLRQFKIYTVKGLLLKTAPDLRRIPGLGLKLVQKIERALADHGLFLSMDPFSALGISPQTADILYGLGIRSLEKLLSKTELDLWRMPRLGHRSIPEIKAALKANGYSFASDPFIDFGFSFSAAKFLHRAGFSSPVELAAKTEAELRQLREFQRLPGRRAEKMTRKIKKVLESQGMSLAIDPLVSFGLPFKIALKLHRAGIHSPWDLRHKTEDDLLLLSNMGTDSVWEIREALAAKGWSLASASGP